MRKNLLRTVLATSALVVPFALAACEYDQDEARYNSVYRYNHGTDRDVQSGYDTTYGTPGANDSRASRSSRSATGTDRPEIQWDTGVGTTGGAAPSSGNADMNGNDRIPADSTLDLNRNSSATSGNNAGAPADMDREPLRNDAGSPADTSDTPGSDLGGPVTQ